jgi:hypothetical protein
MPPFPVNRIPYLTAIVNHFQPLVFQGVRAVAEQILKNRTRFTSSLKNELIEQFDRLAEQTRITKTKTRLLDEAIKDLLKKHGVETQKVDKQ